MLSVAAIAVLTRALTPTEYGLYALVIAAVTMLNSIIFTWNSKAVYRSFASLRSDPSRLFRAAIVGFASSFIASIICVLLIYEAVDTKVDAALLLGGGLLLAAYAWIELASSILNLEGRAIDYVALMSSRAAINVCLGGLAAWLTGSAAWVICVMAFGWGVLAIVPRFSSWVWRAQGATIVRSDMTTMLRYGVPLSLSIALSQLISSADRGLLGLLSGPGAVAMYAVGYDLVQFCIGAIGSALSLAYYPRIIAAADVEGTEPARAILHTYSVVQLAVVLPAAVGLACVARPLAEVIVGESLRNGAAEVMPLISISALLITLKAFYADFSFQLARWTLGGAVTSAVALVANIGCNLILIPRDGIWGAALAAVIATAIGLGLSLLISRKKGFPLPGLTMDHLRVVVSVGLMAFVLKLFGTGRGFSGLALDIITGAAIYAVAMVMLNPLHVRAHVIASIARARACLAR